MRLPTSSPVLFSRVFPASPAPLWGIVVLALLLVAAAPRGAVGQTTILQETFENDGEGTRYDAFENVDGTESSIISTFSDGGTDYFTRTDDSNIGSGVSLSGPEGSFFFAGQDVDGEGATPPLALELASANTSDFSNLTVKALVAEDDDGSSEDWDDDDYLRLQYSTDGGSTFDNLICFAGDGSNFNSEPGIDSDCDGVRDAGGTSLTDTFTEFTGSISGSPSDVILRVKAQLNSGDEDFAIDNIRLEGTSGDPDPTVQFTSNSNTVGEGDGSTTLTAEISNPDGNEVNVDVALDGGSSADASDIGNYSTQTVTFPSSANDGDTKDVTVNITDDSSVEGTETATFNLTNLQTNGNATVGSPSQFDLEITDNDAQLIISQYVDTESGTTPKGIELRNVSGSTIDFSSTNLAVERYANGGTSPTTTAEVTSGTLADGEVMVIGGADLQTHMTNNFPGVRFINNSFSFNGNDALEIVLGGTTQDVFGTIGNDPGTAWSGSEVSTADQNIQLLSGITSGSGGFTDPSTRFETVVDNPTGSGDLKGFGTATDLVSVNEDGTGNETFFPCDVSPDESDIASGLSQVGANDNVFVCPGSYNETSLDIQTYVTLASGADATISDQLTLSSGTFDVESGSLTLTSTGDDGSKTAYIAGSGSGSVEGDVTFERYFDKSDDASHFRFLSAPTATLLDDEGSGSNAGNLLSNMWTQSSGTDTGADAEGSSVDPSVFTYDEGFNIGSGEDLSDGWTGVTNLNSGTGDFIPGTGFLAFMFADRDPNDGTTEGFPETLTATGSVQAEENNGSAINPPIDFTGGDGDGTANNGWNLIANPFMAPIDWESIENDGSGLNGVDATIYVWNPEKDDYDEYVAASSGTDGTNNGQGRYIAPFQAFFVKANGNASDPDIGGIDALDKNINEGPELKSAGTSTPQVALQLRAEGDTTGKTTAFRFTQDALTGKDAYDAFQLEPLGTSRTQVASQMAGTDALFAVQSRPVPAEADTIGLSLDITEGGTYSLAASALQNLPGDWKVILENTDSGARWDLGAGESATFSVEGTQSKSTAEDVSPAALLKDGPTVAKASTDNGLPSYRLYVGPAAALPVELASFEATASGSAAQLTWATASETNNAGFHIERRGPESDGFASMGFVEGHGTTTQPQRYRYRTRSLGPGRHVFRLRQVDLDGSETRSDTVSVRLRLAEAATMAVAPNPVQTRATATLRVRTEQSVTVALYDVLGRRVRTVHEGPLAPNRAHTLRIDADALSSGLYLLRANGERFQETRRVTVVR